MDEGAVVCEGSRRVWRKLNLREDPDRPNRMTTAPPGTRCRWQPTGWSPPARVGPRTVPLAPPARRLALTTPSPGRPAQTTRVEAADRHLLEPTRCIVQARTDSCRTNRVNRTASNPKI